MRPYCLPRVFFVSTEQASVIYIDDKTQIGDQTLEIRSQVVQVWNDEAVSSSHVRQIVLEVMVDMCTEQAVGCLVQFICDDFGRWSRH